MDFFEACEAGNLEEVKLFLEKGTDVNCKNNNPGNWTALFYASKFGHVKIVKHLLKYGANVDINSSVGATPLMLASHFGHFEVVKTLLEHDANPNFKSFGDSTALTMTLKGSNGKKRYNILLLHHQSSRLLDEDEKNFLHTRKYRCSFGLRVS